MNALPLFDRQSHQTSSHLGTDRNQRAFDPGVISVDVMQSVEPPPHPKVAPEAERQDE